MEREISVDPAPSDAIAQAVIQQVLVQGPVTLENIAVAEPLLQTVQAIVPPVIIVLQVPTKLFAPLENTVLLVSVLQLEVEIAQQEDIV